MADDNNKNNVVSFPRLSMARPRITIDDLKGRLGYFSISFASVQQYPDTVMDVMAKCIVLQAGPCQHGATVYLALSREFAVVDDTKQPPFYEWMFKEGAWRAFRVEQAG